MKKIISVFVAAMVLTACSKKSTPTASPSATTAPAARSMSEDEVPAAPAVAKAGDDDLTAAGKEIYMAKCNKCHGYKDPGNYSRERWVPIMDKMAVKSNLSASEKSSVLMYVQAHAKK